MKPIQLEVQAFGPFAARQTVDFEKLSEAGIFLIKGKTGSGKTTIFDAMTFALYGGSSGTADKVKTGRNDFEEWRCNQAPSDLPTEVSYTFSVHGKKYYFRRFLIKSTRSDKLNPKYEAGEINADGNEIPFFNNPKEKDLNSKAEELIGLTRDQFRQVVLLPQGQFERFLTAPSDEKEDILKKIFNSERWECYAQKFFDAAYRRQKNLEEEKIRVLAALAEESTDEGVPMTDLEQLGRRVDFLGAEREQRQTLHAQFSGEKKRKALDADLRLDEQFKALHKLEDQKKKLAEQEKSVRDKQRHYTAAETAEEFRALIADFESAQQEHKNRAKALERERLALPIAEQAAKDAEAMLREKEAASPIPTLQQKIGEYEAKKPFYEQLTAFSLKWSEADAAQKKAKREYQEASTTVNLAVEELRRAELARERAEETAREYRTRYFAGICGEISADLVEGEKCPVCGSVHHPSPAVKMPGSVSKTEMEDKESRSEEAKKRWDQAEKKRAEASDRRDALQKKLTESDTLVAAAEANLRAAKNNLIEGIPDAAALRRETEVLLNAIDAFHKKLESLKSVREGTAKALQAQLVCIASAEEEKKRAEEKQKTAGSMLQRALEEKGCSDYMAVKQQLLPQESRRVLHEEIVRYERDCENTKKALGEKRAELAGKVEPDASMFDARKAEIDAERENFSKKEAELCSEIERLKKKQEELTDRWNHYRGEITQAENDLRFARKLRGDSGIGIQRYVLAVMFNQIIGEANRMLEKIHGGRYRLFRSDKGAGKKGGLELSVHDNRCPEQSGRPVSMLSGGEQFLVSLALSIGMSTVAQKSGVQIDALFIDEGFGTLDENSIGDAMDVLEAVRRSSSTIGIISHVQVLEGTLHSQLEVVKAESGNYIKMV